MREREKQTEMEKHYRYKLTLTWHLNDAVFPSEELSHLENPPLYTFTCNGAEWNPFPLDASTI